MKKRNSDTKNKVNAKKGQRPRKRDESNGKEKNWTLFVTDQAPDNAVCPSNDKDYKLEHNNDEDESNDRTIEWILDCVRMLPG
jgi:hypothetical protein